MHETVVNTIIFPFINLATFFFGVSCLAALYSTMKPLKCMHLDQQVTEVMFTALVWSCWNFLQGASLMTGDIFK
jgi:hypothetical protein